MKASELLTKSFYVGSVEITSSQIGATFCHLRGEAGFTNADVQHNLTRAGVPAFRDRHHVASEVANRLLQRFRKLGLVNFHGGYWWPSKRAFYAITAQLVGGQCNQP